MMRRKQTESAVESEMHDLCVAVPDNISKPASEALPIDVPDHFLLPLSDSPLTSEPTAHASRAAALKILYHQFKGLPPPSDLGVESSKNRFSLLCSPKALLRKVGIGMDGRGGSAIVYDRNTASVPGFHLPLVLNMVGDNVKNRLMNVLGFACIFCSVILILASFTFVAAPLPIPQKVSSSLTICRALPHICPPFSVQIILFGSPNSTSFQTSCPDTSSGVLLRPCLMLVRLQITSADGASIQNKHVIVSESLNNPFFTVDSPFSPVGKTYTRNDGSSGDSSRVCSEMNYEFQQHFRLDFCPVLQLTAFLSCSSANSLFVLFFRFPAV
jgi:hypothetical protein